MRLVYKNNLTIRLKGLDIDNLGNEELDIFGTAGRIKVNPDDEFKVYVLKSHKIYRKTKTYQIKNISKIDNSQLLNNALNNIKELLDGNTKINISPAENSQIILQIVNKLKLDK